MQQPNTSPYKILAKSLGIITFLGGLSSVVVWLITNNIKFSVAAFILSLFIQFVGGFLISIYTDNKKNKAADRAIESLISQIKEFKTPLSLTCAYCHETNIVPISLTEENSFSCKECKKTNTVSIQFRTSRITTMLSTAVPVLPEIKEEEK